MFTGDNQNIPALPAPVSPAGFLEAPAAEASAPEGYDLGPGRYEQALVELRIQPTVKSEASRREVGLLLWEIGMLATIRDCINELPADVRAEREPAIQAERSARTAKLERPPLTWPEWLLSRETAQQEVHEWGAAMEAQFVEMKSFIPQEVQDERNALLAKRYAARRAERAHVAAEWRDRREGETPATQN